MLLDWSVAETSVKGADSGHWLALIETTVCTSQFNHQVIFKSIFTCTITSSRNPSDVHVFQSFIDLTLMHYLTVKAVRDSETAYSYWSYHMYLMKYI